MMNVLLIPSCVCAGPMVSASIARAGAQALRLASDAGVGPSVFGADACCACMRGENGDVARVALGGPCWPHGHHSPDYHILNA